MTNQMLADPLASYIIRVESRKGLPKGFRAIFIKQDIGYDGDDFIHDVRTVATRFKLYKKPRFVK